MVLSGADDRDAPGPERSPLAKGVVGNPQASEPVSPAQSPAHRDGDGSPLFSDRHPGPGLSTTSSLAGLRAGGPVGQLNMSRCGQGHFLEEVTGIGDRKPAFWGGKPIADPVPALPFLTCSLKALPLQLLGTSQAHSRLQRCHEDQAGPHGTLRGHSEVRPASGHTTDEGSPTAPHRLP